MNVIDGDSVVFHCRAKADEISFFVNGTFAYEQLDKGFKESIVTDIDETRERTLTATALTQYNNTNIICRALSTMNIAVEAVISDPAILIVQGNINILAVMSNN